MSTSPQNYYAENPLNRLSYLRSASAFLSSALSSPKARFVIYDSLSPLCTPLDSNGAKHLHLLKYDDVKEFVGADPDKVFKGVDGKSDVTLGEYAPFLLSDEHLSKGVENLTKEEKTHYFINQPALVFLGVDERSAPDEAKSLPLTKPTETSTLESHSPYGIPYWAIDATRLDKLKKKAIAGGEGFEFTDMRAGMQTIPGEEAAIAAEGRALTDWATRNKFCPACSRPMRSVWAGWKRACLTEEPAAAGLDAPPACISKRGVHNFNYPRCDPVVIMAIASPDRERLLLGRQKAWPKKFYSCLAGFIESGETFEEAVRREVYEEAGVEVGEVYYHSSQPWPYPSSLMLGAIGIAKEGQEIRCDLDNELEDARYFTREEVLKVINSSKPMQLSREEVSRIDGKEGTSDATKVTGEEDAEALFRMPPATAIANVLIKAWATNSYLGASSSGTGKL